MRLYENVFVTRADLIEDEVEKLGVNIREIITSKGFEVVAYQYCGVRNLAYDINNNNKGHFYLTQFSGDKNLIDQLDHVLKINEDVIRYITVAIPETNEELKEILIKEKKDFE